MTTERKNFTMRLLSNNYAKLKNLSKKNKRSMAAELEYILEQYFESYELQNGQISSEMSNKTKTSVNNHQVGNNQNTTTL